MSDERGPLLRVPPPAIFIGVFLIALWMEAALYRIWLVEDTTPPRALLFAGLALLVVGGIFVASAMLAFRRFHTPILPFQRAAQLVTTGPYRYSRNPMYAGLAIMHIGGALMLNAGWPILLLPVALLLLYLLVIRREESMMASTFGEDYETYRRRVRRWL